MSIVNFHNNTVTVECTKTQALGAQSSVILADEFIQSLIKNKTLSNYMIKFKSAKDEVEPITFNHYISQIKSKKIKTAYSGEEIVEKRSIPAKKVIEEEAKPKRGRPAKKVVEESPIEEEVKPKPKRGRPSKKVAEESQTN